MSVHSYVLEAALLVPGDNEFVVSSLGNRAVFNRSAVQGPWRDIRIQVKGSAVEVHRSSQPQRAIRAIDYPESGELKGATEVQARIIRSHAPLILPIAREGQARAAIRYHAAGI